MPTNLATAHRRVLAALVCALTLSQSSRAQSPPTPLRDFPSYDAGIASVLRRAADAKQNAARLATGQATAELVAWLAGAERIEEALAALQKIIAAGDVAQTVAALKGLASRLVLWRSDDGKARAESLNRILEPLRARLPSLPREDAARFAAALVSLDNQTGPNDWVGRQRQLIEAYPGTQAASLAEVEIQGGREALQVRLDALERFAASHPGTVAAAKAVYQRASLMSSNPPASERGRDPSGRFFQIVDAIKDLESDRYPANEWRGQVAGLLSSFYVSSNPPPPYAPGNVEKTLTAYREFVLSHVDAIVDEDLIDSRISYIVTAKMGSLFELAGGRLAGLESLFVELEARAADKAAVRLFRAQFYMQESTHGAEADRASMAGKARTALSALASEKNGYTSRKALACLAAMAYYTRDYDRALPAYQQYVATYAASPWTWLASLRIGRVYEARGEWKTAADHYQRAAKTFGSESFAGVVGHSSAARAFDALGRFDDALAEYRLARAAWDDDYGREYHINSSQAPGPPQTAGVGPMTRPVDPLIVTKVQLDERVAMLTRAFAMPGGALFMRGRGELERGRFVDARATFAQFLKDFPGSVASGDARELLHRAQLERALELASFQNPVANTAAATAAFAELGRDPFDAAVGIAQMAAATLEATRGTKPGATEQLRATLAHFVEAQRPRLILPPAGSLEADIAEIRTVVFRPTGDFPLFGEFHWNAFTFPRDLPSFVVMSADVQVRLFDRTVTTPRLYQRFPGIDNVVFLTTEELALLERVIPTLGGTSTRTPGQVMETPNQPVGTARDIVALWSQLFPTRPGHWGGFELTTYPRFDRIEFLDAARTKANAFVTIGYSGATVVLEKVDGKWKAIRLTNQWVT